MLYIQLPQANDCSRYQTSNNADEDSARILPHSSFHADIGWSNILVRISPLFWSDWSRGTYMYTGCDLETNCLLPCIDITTYWQYSRPTTHGACAPQGRFSPYPCTISQHSSVSTKRSNSVLDTYRSGFQHWIITLWWIVRLVSVLLMYLMQFPYIQCRKTRFEASWMDNSISERVHPSGMQLGWARPPVVCPLSRVLGVSALNPTSETGHWNLTCLYMDN